MTVELDEQPGLRYSSTVVGSPKEEIQIGRRVELDWIMRGSTPLPVFRLAGPGTSAPEGQQAPGKQAGNPEVSNGPATTPLAIRPSASVHR